MKFNPRRRGAQAGLAIIAVSVASMFGASTASTAGAGGTNAGNATIVSPHTPRPELHSGGSQTAFSINLPQRASCSKDTANGQYHVYGYIVPSGTDPGGLQWDANGPLLGRTDPATVTAKSPTVLDPSIQATDQGMSVAGFGIPGPAYFVGTVTPGSSFLLSSSATSQVNVNATANGSSVVIGPPNAPDQDTHTLYDLTGSPYVAINTAITTGQIPVPVPDFNWSNYSLTGLVGGFQTLTLPAGTYNVGIACVTNTLTTDKFWNVQLTFSANSSDPNGESWVLTAPDPPTHLVATPGIGSASVAFTPSTFAGAMPPITGYTVTCTSSNGGATGSASGSGSPIVVNGLTNGSTYTCTATASTAAATSVASAPSNSFVPLRPTTTAIASSAQPSQNGAPVTFTATVSPAPTGGTVSFTDTGSAIPGCQLVPLVGASATCTDNNLAGAGSHIIVASYSGTVGYSSSLSPSFGQVVLPTMCNRLAGCNLSSLNLSGASLSGANFKGANMAGDNLSGANLSGADLTGVNLASANLTNANLSGAITKGANLSNVTWSNTTCPDGTNSDGNGGTCIGHT